MRSNEQRGLAPKAVLLASDQWVTVTPGVPLGAADFRRQLVVRSLVDTFYRVFMHLDVA